MRIEIELDASGEYCVSLYKNIFTQYVVGDCLFFAADVDKEKAISIVKQRWVYEQNRRKQRKTIYWDGK